MEKEVLGDRIKACYILPKLNGTTLKSRGYWKHPAFRVKYPLTSKGHRRLWFQL